MSHHAHVKTVACPSVADTGPRDCLAGLDSCEVGEDESDNDGRKRALSSTDDVTHIDGDLAIGWLRHDNGAVGGIGWVWETELGLE